MSARDATPGSGPIRVLILYDVEGWAWWHRSRNIQRHVSAQVRVDILREGQGFDHRDYDLVLVFESEVLRLVRHVPAQKLIVGSSCPKTWDAAIAALREGGLAAGVVNSRQAWEYARPHGRFYCCQNGVDAELFHPPGQERDGQRKGRPLTACWVGNSRSVGNKGLELIRQACARAGVELLCVDQADNVYAGRLHTQEELRDLVYHRADFYVCASECEGTPNPALEALACGLPVVSTPVGNMPEVIRDGENGFLTQRSADGLAGGMERLKAADLPAMSSAARRAIEDGWTWVGQAAKYEAMFQDVLAGPQGRRAHE